MLSMFNKKKEEDNVEETKGGSFFDMLKNKRKRAGITLGFYLLFFIAIFIMIGIYGSNDSSELVDDNSEGTEELEVADTNVNYGYITYSHYEPLLYENYEYEITYTVDEEDIIISGSRYEDYFSALAEDYIYPGVEELLNIDDLIEVVKLEFPTTKNKYDSGGIVQKYEVKGTSFAEIYDMTEYNDEIVTVTIYSNGSYVDKIEMDLTSFFIDNPLEISIFLSEVGRVESVNE